jgi:hypothetical protein
MKLKTNNFLVTCANHGKTPGQIVCDHLAENGGDYVPIGETNEGLVGMYLCRACFDAGPEGSDDAMHCWCMHCVSERLLPKLGKNLAEGYE